MEQCPYCRNDIKIAGEIEPNVLQTMQCPHCKKNFVYEAHVVITYELFQADCLNEGEHQYRISRSHPKEHSTMECDICKHNRPLTPAERLLYRIDV